MSEIATDEVTLCLLSKLFSAATQHASAAMRGWAHGRVDMVLDEVKAVSLEDAAAEFDLGDELLTMVVLGIQGELGGQTILAFDDLHGRRFASGLLGREPSADSEWSALEQSAAMETGNIVASAYLSELTRLIDHKLIPSPPILLQDFGASVLQQAIMMQAIDSETVLMCRTQFTFDDQSVSWSVLFIPSADLLQTMQNALLSAA